MPTLYRLTLSRRALGFVSGPVRAVPSLGITGHLRNGVLVVPDVDAVRECLPHYYRKAFDRAGQAFWFTSEAGKGADNSPAYCTLYSARGRLLNTLYATPYEFNPNGPEVSP